MNQELAPDINDHKPFHEIAINKVGISKLRQQVKLMINTVPLTVPAEFNLSIELPSTYRAAHMSRNLEAMREVLTAGETDNNIILDNHEICPQIASKLLDYHDYTTRAYAEVMMEYFAKRFSPRQKLANLESFKVRFGAVAIKENNQKRINHSLEVVVEGTTTCPCAQNQARFRILQRLSELNIDIDQMLLEQIVFPTHMQRATVAIHLTGMDSSGIFIDDLISLAEDSMSNSTHALLKRDDEEDLIRKAFLNPKFVEDVARSAAYKLAVYSPKLGDQTHVLVSVETQESIHKHNAYAEISATIKDLRESSIQVI